MTDQEAQAVAAVIATVDNYCYMCAGEAACALEEALPEHNWPKLVATAGGWSEAAMRDRS